MARNGYHIGIADVKVTIFERLVMGKTLKDLLLALLNATLILVALCLFLGWQLMATVDGITSGFAEKIQIVAPLRDEVKTVRDEITGLRSDLSAIQAKDAIADTEVAQTVSETLAELEQLQAQLRAAQDKIAQITESPDGLINTAIETTADTIADRIIAIRGCNPDGS